MPQSEGVCDIMARSSSPTGTSPWNAYSGGCLNRWLSPGPIISLLNDEHTRLRQINVPYAPAPLQSKAWAPNTLVSGYTEKEMATYTLYACAMNKITRTPHRKATNKNTSLSSLRIPQHFSFVYYIQIFINKL